MSWVTRNHGKKKKKTSEYWEWQERHNCVNTLAFLNGCPNPANGRYSAGEHVKGRWRWQMCLGTESRVRAHARYSIVRHFTTKKCFWDGEVRVLCMVRGAGNDRWRLASVHNVGECPYCEYRPI